MTTDKSLYLHCGFPKTGTTSLQTWLFPRLPETRFLGRSYPAEQRSDQERRLLGALQVVRGSGAAVQVEDGARLLRELAGTSDRVLVSDEMILAQCLVPYREGAAVTKAVTVPEVFLHLQAVAAAAGFERTRILCTLRPQSQLLSSFFAESFGSTFAKIDGLRTFDGYVDDLLGKGGLVDAAPLDFPRLRQQLVGIFGDEAVLFLSLHALSRRPEAFARRLFDFMGLEVDAGSFASLLAGKRENTRRAGSGAASLRIRRKNLAVASDYLKRTLFPNVRLGIGRHVRQMLLKAEFGPKRIEVSDATRQRIEAHFRAANMAMALEDPDLRDAFTDSECPDPRHP